MNLGTPDRVPVMCQFSIGHMLLQLGVSPAEFWCDAATYVDGLCRMREIYDFDGILVSLHGHDPAWRSRVASRQEKREGEEVLWTDGSRTLFPWDDLPRHSPAPVPPPHPPVERAEDGPPLDYIPVSQGLRFGVHPAHAFDAIEDVVRRSAGRYSIHGEVTSPFDYLLDQRGHQTVLLTLLEDPSAVKHAMGTLTAKIITLADAMCQTGVDAIKLSSPYAGAGFISPSTYAEFILPYEREIIRAIRGRGVKAYLHTCGAIRDRLEMMIASGADGIECLDPPPLGDIELSDALGVTRGRCFVKGNVDSVNLLLWGKRADIITDVRARLEVGTRAGGFILSTACSIAPHVPREHVMLLRQSVE